MVSNVDRSRCLTDPSYKVVPRFITIDATLNSTFEYDVQFYPIASRTAMFYDSVNIADFQVLMSFNEDSLLSRESRLLALREINQSIRKIVSSDGRKVFLEYLYSMSSDHPAATSQYTLHDMNWIYYLYQFIESTKNEGAYEILKYATKKKYRGLV